MNNHETFFIAKLKDRVCSRAYREFLTRRVCVRCGSLPSDPAHVISRKRADGSDLTCLPLCRPCHRAFDGAGVYKIEWLEKETGRTVPGMQMTLRKKFRIEFGLPMDGEFEDVLREAGLIEPPFSTRKNR